MKAVFAVLMLAGLLPAAGPQAAKSTAGAPAGKPASATPAQRVEIPSGAVEGEDGRFHYTDKDGRKWVYMRTPFGIARSEDKSATSPNAAAAEDPFDNVKITQSGDTVRFERPGPFGTYRWTKKVSELNEREKAALSRSREGAAGQAGKTADSPAKQEE